MFLDLLFSPPGGLHPPGFLYGTALERADCRSREQAPPRRRIAERPGAVVSPGVPPVLIPFRTMGFSHGNKPTSDKGEPPNCDENLYIILIFWVNVP